MVFSAGKTFKKKWFRSFDCVFNKISSQFYKLELLVSKLVKASWLVSGGDFVLLLDTWNRLDSVGTLSVRSLFLFGASFDAIRSGLAKTRKSYCTSKLLKLKPAKESSIRQAIERRMESFEVDKDHTIRSVLKCPFCKVVLNHLVDGGELVLEPELVKSKVDGIMEGWTRKCVMASDISDDWARQFLPLNHVFNDVFSDIMHLIGFDKMFGVISNLSDGKAAGLFGIPNELWKHCDKSVLDMLLVLLNFCLGCKSVPKPWRKVWVSMIPKSYKWKGVLTNTCPIALIETAYKVFSKILSDWISLVCNTFDVLCGDNFSVLKGTFTQLPIFAIGSVIKDALEKNQEFSQAATQHILNVASKFFRLNDISINNDKTVAIPINCRVATPYLTISGMPISITNRSEPHHYLGIFLSSDGLSKSNLVKVHLDTFEQIQAESKSASVIAFVNLVGVLGCLFSHRSHNLQVLSWRPRHPLLFPVRVRVSPLNNFLAGVVCIFSGCDLSLDGSLAGTFHLHCSTSMFLVLGETIFFKYVSFLRRYGIAFIEKLCDRNGIVFDWKTFKCWKRLDPHGPVPSWFDFFVCFLGGVVFSSGHSLYEGVDLLSVGAVCLSVYTDGSLSNLGTVDILTGTVVFFENIGSGLDVGVFGLVSSTLVELQAIALALECVKSYLGVSDNECANALAKNTVFSAWHLSYLVSERFLKVGVDMVFGNSKHFVHDVFRSIYRTHWEVGSGSWVVPDCLHADIDWLRSSLVWHPDSHMVTGFTSIRVAGFHTYFMKALHYCLSVAVQKRLYDRGYPSVVCLFCGEIKVSDHVFSCSSDTNSHVNLLDTYTAAWEMCSGLFHSSSCVSQLLSTCISNVTVSMALCKGFVFGDWYCEFVSVYKNPKVAVVNVVNFVQEFCLAFRNNIWLVCVKYQAIMEKNKLILCDGSIPVTVSGFSVWLLAGVIRLLGVADALGISFRYCKHCLFYAGVGDMTSVYISA
ncbi:hypothetical protein G9A89_016526 [Geosiphon pyriformis]|nr:hypothetical protein G9A89_016526 [Geosiphon pyriformis]